LKITATKVALVAVFAALQAVLSVFPFTITIGVSGQITLGVIGGPLIGILLGPFFGGSAVLIGSIVGAALNPIGAIFSFWTVIPPTVGALSAGFTRSRRGYAAGAIILVFLMIFYVNPVGREVFVYTWFHIIAMIVAFSSIAYIEKPTREVHDTGRSVGGIVVAALVGVLSDHIAGSAIAAWYFNPTPVWYWYTVMFIYPFERIIAFLLTALIAVPIFYSLERSGLTEKLK
jgi:hypothetical protein